jgi:3-dehydroquinate dehydratase I
MANQPKICVSVTNDDHASIKKAEPLADLFEVRMDLIGKNWRETAGILKKPWIACNRRADEGGKARGNDEDRVKELLSAIPLGAAIIDIELMTPGLARYVKDIKGKAQCLISYHNFKETPAEKLRDIVRQELDCGADICKVATMARSFADNLAVLQLIKEFPGQKIVAFTMGETGQISRVLCPLAGGYFTYASIRPGKESAPGQMEAETLIKLYGMMQNG